jgi:hypothetical protein
VQSLGPRRMPTTASAVASSHAPGSSQVQNLAFYLQNVSKRTSARSNMNICLQRIRGDADSSDEDLHDLLRAEALLESSKSRVSNNSSTIDRKHLRVSSSCSPFSKRSLLSPFPRRAHQDDSDSTTPVSKRENKTTTTVSPQMFAHTHEKREPGSVDPTRLQWLGAGAVEKDESAHRRPRPRHSSPPPYFAAHRGGWQDIQVHDSGVYTEESDGPDVSQNDDRHTHTHNANLSAILGTTATMLSSRGRLNHLLRLAIAKGRRVVISGVIRLWIQQCWAAIRQSARALSTMQAIGKWAEPGMVRGRQGNLWAASSRRPALTLAQLLRLRKSAMEKLAWLVLVQRRALLMTFFRAWFGKLSSWRLLRSYLPRTLRTLAASKSGKLVDACRPLWRLWEMAGVSICTLVLALLVQKKYK